MNRKILKENAKASLKRKQGEAIFISFIMSLFAGGSSFSFNFGGTGGATTDSGYYEDSSGAYGDIFSDMPEETFETFIIFMAILLMVFIGIALVSSLISIFLAPVFNVGGNRFFLKLRKGAPTGISEIIGNFKDGNYKNLVKVSFFKFIQIFLWTLLFIIPGLIKSFEYMLVDYILAVRPDIDHKTALNMSKRLMDGHKGDAFVLGLSFWGWQLLSIFGTCGILSIVYVNPYIYATLAEFYAYVRADGIKKGIITPQDLPDYESPSASYDFNPVNGTNWQPQGFDAQPPYGAQPSYQPPYGAQPPYQPPYGAQPPYQPPYGAQPTYQPPYGAQPPYQPPYGAQSPYQPPYGAQSPYQTPYGAQSPYQTPYGAQSPYQTPYGAQSPYQPPYGTQPPYQPQQQTEQEVQPNKPVDNVDYIPGEQPKGENDAVEVDFKQVDDE